MKSNRSQGKATNGSPAKEKEKAATQKSPSRKGENTTPPPKARSSILTAKDGGSTARCSLKEYKQRVEESLRQKQDHERQLKDIQKQFDHVRELEREANSQEREARPSRYVKKVKPHESTKKCVNFRAESPRPAGSRLRQGGPSPANAVKSPEQSGDVRSPGS